MFGLSAEDAEAEREERLLFPDIDRILALAYPDAKTFIAALAEEAWLTNPMYTGKYAEIVTQQVDKIELRNWNRAHTKALHRADEVFTALCKKRRKNTVWFGCPVCPEQLIRMFSARLRMDGKDEELELIPPIVEIYSAIRGCYVSIRELIFTGAENNADFRKNAGREIMNAHATRRKTVTAKLNWDKIIKLGGAADLRDMLEILQEMNKMQASENKPESSINSVPLASLKLTPEGSFSLTDSENRELETQLRDAGGPAQIALEDCRLLMNMVGKGVAAYSPGTSDLASLPSAAPLVAFIANAAAKLTGPTNVRRIPTMARLKLTTLRMTLGDRWELAFFGPVVAKNGELVSKTIKKEANQFSEATNTQKRLDLWAKIDTMENVGIATRGLALAVGLLAHPSILTRGEVMEWFLATACL